MKGKGNDNNPKDRSFETLHATLREDLDDRFIDGLIQTIVSDFLENETLRLKASEYKVQAISPINIEYRETISDLNSHAALLSRWSNLTPSEYDKKVRNLISDYENSLDSIITVPNPFYLTCGDQKDKKGNPIQISIIHDSAHPSLNFNNPPYYLQVTSVLDGSIKTYRGPKPKMYCFYYTALLALLKGFVYIHIKTKKKRGKADESGLNLSDYAAILYYATEANYYKRIGLEVEYSKFIDLHHVNTDFKHFKSAVSDIGKIKRRRVKGRKERITGIIKEFYPLAEEKMLNDYS